MLVILSNVFADSTQQLTTILYATQRVMVEWCSIIVGSILHFSLLTGVTS